MYILRLLRGGLSDRCDYPRARIRAGEFQCQQFDLPQRTDAGAGSSAHGSQSGVCAIGNGCGRDRGLANFEIFPPNAGPSGTGVVVWRGSRSSLVVGRSRIYEPRTTNRERLTTNDQRPMPNFLQTVKQRVVIYDGAMGTNIQKRNPTLDDYWGKENCSEVLVLSRPDIIREIHSDFFRVGCDVVETNTFGGTSLVLGEFDLRDKVREINLKAAQLAREVAQQFSTRDKPRFVAGSMGPTTKLPSLGHIGWDAMLASYEEQALALIEGGVDVLLIETCQDLLQAKIATVAVLEAMRKAGKRLPVQVQVTLQESGTMLLGTEIGAALTALEPYDIDVIGLNCATGPAEMNEAVRYLGLNSTKYISVLPNAGLPQNVGGHAVYKLAPKDLAEFHKHFVKDYGVRIVGGCCGTTPEHLKAVVDAVSGVEPAERDVKPAGAASSAYTSVPLDLEPKPLIVAEEMNTTTRVDHFRKLVQAKKYDDILTLAKKLANEGSHMLDLCCAIVGEDEKGYVSAILEKIATRVPAPILIDSTEADVVEEALKRISGKAIINSINLEDGEKRTSKVLPMAKRYGAGVIALTIDEEGMALTADRKVAIAHRIFDLAVNKYGIRPVDLIFDALTLPISTGQEDYRTAGIETLKAVKRIREELPEVKTILGGQQYFVWAECLFAPHPEQRLHARSGGSRPR